MVHIIRVGKSLFRAFFAVAVFVALLCAGCPQRALAADAPFVSAQGAILTSNGVSLYAKNPDLRLPMASTTKLMTALIALEHCALDEQVEIKSEYCNVEGSLMYLSVGDTNTVEELVAGLLLVSGNDAALALAGHIAGDSAHFAALMNEKAQSLGMNDTHFVNPHGLTAQGHYTTARDLARLMEHCMQNAAFARLNAMKSFTVDDKLLLNHNRLLTLCNGCVGGKTGYTEAAGRCLVSCCERNGMRVVCVTLNDANDWQDHCTLYDWAYSCCVSRCVTDDISFAVPVVSGSVRWAYLVPEDSLYLLLPPEKELILRAELPWFEFAPVKSGARRGKVTVSVDGCDIAEYYLVYKDTVLSR